MFSRISSALAFSALIAACGAESGAPDGDTIDCAIGAGADYSAVCTLERVVEDSGETLLIHHPDGGFRRLKYDPQTGGLETLGGADTVEDRTLQATGQREFSIGGDRYLVPVAMLVPETPQ